MTISYGLSLEKYFSPPPTKSKAHEWGELVRFFMYELNAEIDKNPYYVVNGKKKKQTYWTEPRVAVKIAPRKRGDDYSRLYELKSMCLDYKRRYGSFGKCFNGALKVK